MYYITEVFKKLTLREKDIYISRLLVPPITYPRLANRHKISSERVRQIFAKVNRKILSQKTLNENRVKFQEALITHNQFFR